MSHKFEDIISLENLCLAWEEFICGKRGKPDVREFACNLMDNIIALREDLASKVYQHGNYKERHIWDPKRRLIHIAPVRDRLLHHAIYRILYPFFECTFIGDSYSCRIDKGVHKAFNRFRVMAYKVSRNHKRTCWVLKCDIKKFFASIDQDVIFGILKQYIPDQDILWLLGQVIRSFATVSSRATKGSVAISRDEEIAASPSAPRNDSKLGLPLGNLTSQLFSNIYMNELDRFVKHRLKVRHYIRYADDSVFLHHDREWLEAQIPSVEKFLQERLHLQLHPNKVTINTFASGVDFLGWVHFPDHRVLRDAAKRRMMRRLQAHSLYEILQSYLGLLQHGNTFKMRQKVLQSYWFWHDLE
ncbi:MAG: RNA-directed DNA polymerase [Parcubacteria group bacterium GW2011_GWA2_47_26]|nr:MAG: RNA-directed DNA polymerase [Parcubacteria group bacterium GW2011_GWA2_47_26]